MQSITITDQEFGQFSQWLYHLAGISLSPAKKALVSGRLAKRLQHHHLDSYGDYFKLLMSGEQPRELQVAVDLLTTHETYFFREPKHFDFLRDKLSPKREPGSQTFRVWSAACSSGEEPYSIAMVLCDHLGDAPWEVVASDISMSVLEKARDGHYSMERISGISREHLSRYCMRGVGAQEGTLLVERKLRERVQFHQVNLSTTLPALGQFDVIFLRNVMIYFDLETKRQVVARLISLLRTGGHFLVGHSESLNGINEELLSVSPSIYRRP